jgi:hypothetical protein
MVASGAPTAVVAVGVSLTCLPIEGRDESLGHFDEALRQHGSVIATALQRRFSTILF